MRKKIKIFIVLLLIFALLGLAYHNRPLPYEVGEVIDSHNGVAVYYNGHIGNVIGRNLAADGYNIGQMYQCVEFIKRYYYEYLQHKMPDSYGHAKDFYDPALADGSYNKQRDLVQYSNPGKSAPMPDDILVLGRGYGHVGIVTLAEDSEIEIIEQNTGTKGRTRSHFALTKTEEGLWKVENSRVLGWLRKE
jgi:surface antigen